jgi:hypothetical protein
MSKKQLKEKKKHKREADKKTAALRAEQFAVKTRREAKQQHELNRLVRKIQPKDVAAHDERIKEQLHRNMEILAELERAHEAEILAKKKINEDLEAQGFSTIREKMDHLQGQNRDETALGTFGGSADVAFDPAPEVVFEFPKD